MAPDRSHSTAARFAATLETGGREFDKQQQDIALAAVVLQSGLVSERDLSSALSTWTIHGTVPLAEHLIDKKLLDQETVHHYVKLAAERLAECRRPPAGQSPSRSILLDTLESVDPSGSVARLMGIRAVAGAGATDSTGFRQTKGRYRLVRKLGQGGLGRVWLAFDEHLKRHVAVKELTSRGNAMALYRFRREAEITGRLEHPGIVPVYQLGEDSETGEAFYAMRFLGKTTMHDAILEYHERRGEGEDDPMLIRRLLTDFVSICQAIGHAHSRKVIHRDLKPENVAIDSFGQVIVIDWGIAKVLDELETTDTLAHPLSEDGAEQSTMHGQVLGTPMYMAPEQASGRIDELDERTDIYGLGAILFAILTGYGPHERTSVTQDTGVRRDVLSAIASQPTPVAHDANPDADPALSAICAKAMARKRYARYQTASELAEDVQRWMAGERVSAYREKTSQRIARWVQHHRLASQALAALVIIGIVALSTLAIATRQGREAARQVRFDELRGFDREIEVQLKSAAEELTKDARFMSTLPPIQALIAARAGTEGTESEEIWRGRLETIFEGLLRANPDYLAISYAQVDGDRSATDIVRVERHNSDSGYVRSVPLSRLTKLDDNALVGATTSLSPGEILLSIRRDSQARNQVRGVDLAASTPVYDEATGELFGIVVVETDLLNRIVEFLDRVEQSTASIYITGAQGEVWVSDNPETGVVVKSGDVSVGQYIPQTAAFFKDAERHRELERDAGWLAAKLELDPANQETTVGVVLQLWSE